MDGLITCFRCRGEGIIYKYEGQLGSKNECPGCFGRGSLIANTCIQCAKCNGRGRVYEYDDDLGQRYECPLCKNKGYTVDRYIECPKCKGGGRIYPFQDEKLGVPKGCIPCGAIGYIKEKDYYNVLDCNEITYKGLKDYIKRGWIGKDKYTNEYENIDDFIKSEYPNVNKSDKIYARVFSNDVYTEKEYWDKRFGFERNILEILSPTQIADYLAHNGDLYNT